MIFWAIIVFVLGILGLVHEMTMITRGIPIFGEAISIVMMLVALGMLSTLKHQKNKEKK
jgi:hypothetical protein